MTTLEQTPQLEPVHSDLLEVIRGYNPKSHEFKQELGDLNDFAREAGLAAVTLDQIFPPVELEPPSGFTEDVQLQTDKTIDLEPLKGVIYSFADTASTADVPVRRLVTENGGVIQLCDLRPLMTSRVQAGGPKTEADERALDRAFYRDLQFYAEQGRSKNTVIRAPAVSYTKLGGTKSRAYWMPVPTVARDEQGLITPDPDGQEVVTIARVADCRDSVSAQNDMLRRAFHAFNK